MLMKMVFLQLTMMLPIYVCPTNISYTLAVFVKDFKGNESQASQYVAHISAVVYSLLMQTSVKS